ncbi:MAG: hypothetical protein WAK19_11765 [Candidatus Cybelea sp.]
MNKGLRFSVAVLLLSGCSAPPFDSAQGSLRQDGALLRSAPPARSQVRATNVARFHYTGAQQTFTVPSGVTQITVTADGASGAGSTFRHMKGGKGGLVKATIPVTSGETLAIFVGGDGGKSSASGGPGGFNGGGNGGVTGSGNGGGGGGGGYYGGGGGSAGSLGTSGTGGGGGGGASSYIETSATNVVNRRGAAPRGNGEIVITW